jgi:uncharacterized protein (TIGR00725 family)
MDRRAVVAVVGTGRETEPAVSSARELGRLVAENGWVLITGGRNAGVMRAANEGAKQAKESLTIGILPDGSTQVSPAVDVVIVTDVGEARNYMIVLSADVVIACGVDDPGTASEVALALKAEKPIILVEASEAAKEFFTGLAGNNFHLTGSPEHAVQIASKLLLLSEEKGK